MNKSESKKLRSVYIVVAVGLAIVPILLLMGVVSTALGELESKTAVSSTPLLPGPGYLDFTYADPDGNVKDPTGEKPESKLWWNDGYWWGSMYNNTTHAYHIYRLMWGSQTWLDTGVQLDDWRDPLDPKNVKADTMWDAANQKLYVMSHYFAGNAAPITKPENRGRLFRYSYDAANQTYTLDAGYPVDVNEDKTETLVVDKDSTGRLWTTFVSRPSSSGTDYQVYMNYSGVGDAGEANWGGGPFTLPSPDVPITASHVITGDISTVVSYNNHIAVVWSNQTEAISNTLSLAVHPDASSPKADWQYFSYTLPAGTTIDNHLDAKSVATVDDKLFVALKVQGENPGDPGIGMVSYDSGGFSFHTYTTDFQADSRPTLVVDEDDNKVYLFVAGKGGGSAICYKSLDIKDPASSMGDFDPGNPNDKGDCGVVFIEDDLYKKVNNPTSKKDNATALTGIVILAADDDNGQYYVHNTMGDPPPVVDLTEPARNAADAPADLRPISAFFSKEMSAATVIAPDSFVVKGPGDVPLAGTVSYDALLKKGTFVPTLPLALETTYTVELSSAIEDSSGTPLNEGIEVGNIRETWQFTTLSASALPTARFQTMDYTVNEGAGSAMIEVSLSPPSTAQVTVNFSTSDGTATAPDDYTAVLSEPVVFAPGDVSETVFVAIINDNLNELNETVNLHLSGQVPSGVPVDPGYSATLLIEDNDPQPAVSFASPTYTVKEGPAKAIVDVKLSAVSGRDVTVKYATAAGSATPGVDYVETSGTILFAKGQTVQNIEIAILDPALPASGKSFNVNLSEPNGATLHASSAEAKVTISDQSLIFLGVIMGN